MNKKYILIPLAVCLAVGFGAYALRLSGPKSSASSKSAALVAQVPLQPAADCDAPAQAPIADLDRSSPQAAAGMNIIATPAVKALFPGLPANGTWQQFALTSKTITISPYPDMPMTFARDSVKQDGKWTTWSGRSAALPGAILVTNATGQTMDAILVVPGSSQFSYHVDAAGHLAVAEAQPGLTPCGNAPKALDAESLHNAVAVVLTNGQNASALPLADLAPNAPQVNLLFFYDSAVLVALQGTTSDVVAYIDGQTKTMVDTFNVALNQSGVTSFSFRYVGLEALPAYTVTQTDDTTSDLNFLTSNSFVQAKRSYYGADDIVLWRGKSSATESGRANQGPRAVGAVCIWDSWGANGATYKVIAHEVGHNIGCDHDRANATGAKDGNGLHNYGIKWSSQDPRSTYTIGTIMSYSSCIIPYYSNPSLSVHVASSISDGQQWTNIDLGTIPLGVADSAPQAADNVEILNRSGPAMAQLMPHIAMPVITTQPANATIQQGSSASLSVTATGGNLSYQWASGGAAISGATASSYSPTTAGNYSVIVSNQIGSVTSSTATVTVTAVPAPVTPPSSGGGGGGGAMSDWFFGALGVLGLARRWQKMMNHRPTITRLNTSDRIAYANPEQTNAFRQDLRALYERLCRLFESASSANFLIST